MKPLDVLTIGRASVDLYGVQVGGRLEDMGSFQKYVGGSPTNMACGTARLGLRSALITRVGDEHMGRFIREELSREGVDTRGVVTDPHRLTALVILGIRDEHTFPLIFYRADCADMALCEDDIDPGLIGEARAVVATGTHLSHPRTAGAVLKALRLAREGGARTALDIDYRPNLWGLAGHGAGEERFVASAAVTSTLQAHLALFDLIVGTEEEFHIAGGSTDTLEALRAVRAVSQATLVCKRGAAGAVAFTGAIKGWEGGQAGPGFAVEVFNVLGAGDGFMSGLLKGWLDAEPPDVDWPAALRLANACGAFAVSRHGCTPAYPSLEELRFFLGRGVTRPDLRHDPELEQLHWSTNRHGLWPALRVFAFDHRLQMEEMKGATPARIGRFKRLCLRAAERVAQGRPGFGILCDGRLGRDALHEAAGQGLWIGRPAEWPGSRPLRLEPELGPDGGGLSEWPLEHVVKVLCFCHPEDDAAMWADQEATLRRLFASARRNRLEVLLEVIPSKVGATDEGTTARIVHRIYGLGLYPDWWKLEPFTTAAAWDEACRAILAHDPQVRGVVVLGLDGSPEALAESFALAARQPLVKGFAVGRTIFGEAARAWFKDELGDTEAVDVMARRFAGLCSVWDAQRGAGTLVGLNRDAAPLAAQEV